MLLQIALVLLAFVEVLLVFLLLTGKRVFLFAFLCQKGYLLVALALQVQIEVLEELLAALDNGGLMLAVAGILLKIFHL